MTTFKLNALRLQLHTTIRKTKLFLVNKNVYQDVPFNMCSRESGGRNFRLIMVNNYSLLSGNFKYSIANHEIKVTLFLDWKYGYIQIIRVNTD